MKKLLSILSAGLLVCGIAFTSCDDWDVPNTDGAYGNVSIPEGRTITIKDLKDKYNNYIDTDQDTYKTIEEETRIEGVVIGDDETGNIYKQLIVSDGTGAITISINNTGLYAFCPVGQKLVIDCKGLNIGGYRHMAQIGAIFNDRVGQMPVALWKQHVRLVGEPNLKYPELQPVEISSDAEFEQKVKLNEAPMLVTLKNVTIPDAAKDMAYAAEADLAKPTLKFVQHKIKFADGRTCDAKLHTSIYAVFSEEKMPKEAVNITGVLNRYNNQLQLVIRSLDDVKK